VPRYQIRTNGRTNNMSTNAPRVALVTGGARGIGAGIVERLATDGAKVAFTYARADEAAKTLTERLSDAGAQVLAIQADSADPDAITAAIDRTLAEFDRIDVLVNNAAGATFGPLDALSLDEIQTMLDVNIRGVVLATRAVIPHLEDGGRIVNIGSVNADRTPFPGQSVYALTKGAVSSFTRGLAWDLSPRGITITNVQPGPIDTDANPADGPFGGPLRERTANGQFGGAEDVAGLVAFLVSDAAKHITGTSITIDGGFTA
jgi:3-oxoacyl-[acyl-carrier protein] reductase